VVSSGRVRLNPAQEAAVRHRGGPLLVLAGAGTGKTRVITHRVAALLREGVPAWRILAVTFTNKAAAEMRERIAALCPEREDLLKELWVGTFHSICARILRRWGEPVGLSRNFTIYDTSDQLSVMKRVLRDLQISPDLCTPQSVLSYLDRAKNQGGAAEGIARRLKIEAPLGPVVESAARQYQRLLRAADAADFGDLLVLTVRLLEGSGARLRPDTLPEPEPPPPPVAAPEPELIGPIAQQLRALQGALRAGPAPPGPSDSQLGLAFAHLQSELGASAIVAEQDPVVRLRRRFTHIVVDEYQDTNPVQAALIELLGDRAELCVVGDDDQSIYGWRGADVAQILGFPRRHPEAELIRLEQNYRSTNHILGCANALIQRNSGRFGKALFSELGDGEPVRILNLQDEQDEARTIARAIERDLAGHDDHAEPPAIAVFYRTHAQSRVLEQALTHSGQAYAVYGGLRFFERREIKDLLSYLRLLINPASDVDLDRIINVPTRGIGDTTMGRVKQHASERQISLELALRGAPALGLSPRANRQIAGFLALIDALRAQTEGQRLDQIALAILEATGYREMLAKDPSDDAHDRLENVQEFVGSLEDFANENPDKTLADYLEQVALVADADGPVEDRGGTVTLMTIHSAKGLEFDHVYLTGMEERVFPHARVLDDPDQMEEERRLAYVAVTRARRRLTITWARERRLYGQTQLGERSRLLRELPAKHLFQEQHPRPPASRSARPAAHHAPTSLPAYEHSPRARPLAATRDPTWDSDITYDDAEAPSRARGGPRGAATADEGVPLYIGMRVKHPRFGEGELLGWDGAGEGLKLTLRFPGVGAKTILARFCEPA